jgi:hypothetical protein
VAVWLADLELEGVIVVAMPVVMLTSLLVQLLNIELAIILRGCGIYLSCAHLSIPARYRYSTSMAWFHEFDQSTKKRKKSHPRRQTEEL